MPFKFNEIFMNILRNFIFNPHLKLKSPTFAKAKQDAGKLPNITILLCARKSILNFSLNFLVLGHKWNITIFVVWYTKCKEILINTIHFKRIMGPVIRIL